MRRVRCVSPHGGAHHGIRADNELPAQEGYQGALIVPPNEGGWVDNAVLGRVAVGDEVDAPEPPEFICDGFHFVNEGGGPDICAGGGGCWCGGSHHGNVTVTAGGPVSGPGGGGGGAAFTGTSGTLADLLRKGDI